MDSYQLKIYEKTVKDLIIFTVKLISAKTLINLEKNLNICILYRRNSYSIII